MSWAVGKSWVWSCEASELIRRTHRLSSTCMPDYVFRIRNCSGLFNDRYINSPAHSGNLGILEIIGDLITHATTATNLMPLITMLIRLTPIAMLFDIVQL